MTISTVAANTFIEEAWGNAVATDVNANTANIATLLTTRQLIAAKGDLFVGTANDTVAVLSVGATDNQHVIVNAAAATGLKYSPVGVILTDSAQSITQGVVTDITWGTEVSDPAGWTSGGSATLTVPSGAGGRYLVTFSGVWASVPPTPVLNCVYNGVDSYGYAGGAGTGGLGVSSCLTFTRTMVAGDTLKFQVVIGGGAAINFTGRLEIGSSAA